MSTILVNPFMKTLKKDNLINSLILHREQWDIISTRYDNNVEENHDPIISSYLRKENEIVCDLCKKTSDKYKNLCIIEIGTGTGRAIFSIYEKLQDKSIKFFGIDISESMISKANKKKLKYGYTDNIFFINMDCAGSDLLKQFNDQRIKIVMCLYNTIGIIEPIKRQKLIENMLCLAKNGLVIVSASNGDDFGFVAPHLYIPMKKMVGQIDVDSFDERNRVFRNRLGYRSQWFTKEELYEMIKVNICPYPINVEVNGQTHIFGHVFVNNKVNSSRFFY
jgi:SAM-dependent methyltransferase